MSQSVVHLGKNKVTGNFLETLKKHFKKHDNVKVIVLKSAEHNKEVVRAYRDEILRHLGRSYTARIVGFTIFLKKWRKMQR